MQIKKYFRNKKIVYSRYLQPAELVKIFTYNNKKYVRVAFTNRVKFKGTMPVTDVLFANVTGIRKLPSPFKKWLYGLIGIKKVPATFYTIQKKK
jgi:hypothetical protein